VTELKLRHEGVAWKEVDGEIVALDEQAAVYLAANPAGALLWRTLAGGATREALVAELMSEYGIDRDRADADTEAFLRDLGERGLLDT
jgi:Coenzyme PQQ synthesis protein D (PqqD)